MNALESRRHELRAHLRAWAPEFGLSLSDSLIEKLSEHYVLLLRWNERINLTRIIEPELAARFHYLESLYGGRFLEGSIRTLVDVGSGGGFPGIPIALARPDLQVVLIEKGRKRALFLLEVARRLGLENVDVFHGRFEAYRSRDFQAVLCRALERLRERLGELLDFAQMCQQVLLWGGEDLEKTARERASAFWEVVSFAIPHARQRRVILLSRRPSKTPGTTS